MYLRNSQARRLLPMPAGPMTETSRARCSRDVCVEQVLEQAQLVVAPDERRLERVRPAASAALGDDAHRAPRRDRRGLALEQLLAGFLEDDRLRRGALRRLADEHGAGRRDGLEPARGVHEVARDHALVRRADRDRGLAGQDAGPGLDRRAEGAHRVDELEAGPDGPLGVVLVRGGRAPDRHDRVADELLDRPAVALDDVAGELEVAAQELAGLLRVAALGERREADEVGEQDADTSRRSATGGGPERRSRRAGVAGAGRAGDGARRAAGRTRRRSLPRARSRRRSSGNPRPALTRSAGRTSGRPGSPCRRSRRSTSPCPHRHGA